MENIDATNHSNIVARIKHRCFPIANMSDELITENRSNTSLFMFHQDYNKP